MNKQGDQFGRERNANPLLADKWQKQRMAIHRKKLAAIKPSIDITSPVGFRRKNRENNKKKQLQREREEQIQQENMHLLDKLQNIMSNKPRVGLVQNRSERNSYSMKRKQEMERIKRENELILKRIQHRGPTYNCKQWENDFHSKEKVMRNLRKHNYLKEIPISHYRQEIKQNNPCHAAGDERNSAEPSAEEGSSNCKKPCPEATYHLRSMSSRASPSSRSLLDGQVVGNSDVDEPPSISEKRTVSATRDVHVDSPVSGSDASSRSSSSGSTSSESNDSQDEGDLSGERVVSSHAPMEVVSIKEKREDALEDDTNHEGATTTSVCEQAKPEASSQATLPDRQSESDPDREEADATSSSSSTRNHSPTMEKIGGSASQRSTNDSSEHLSGCSSPASSSPAKVDP